MCVKVKHYYYVGRRSEQSSRMGGKRQRRMEMEEKAKEGSVGVEDDERADLVSAV